MNFKWEQTVALVKARAHGRCEYCLMHQSLQGATFHVEHILPQSKGGSDVPENLAWCCPSCNLRKSDRVEGADPLTGGVVALFNPRLNVWSDHFGWEGYEVVGKTPIGRSTIAALQMNGGRRMAIRRAEQQFGLFPN